jgi:hypothetical protein
VPADVPDERENRRSGWPRWAIALGIAAACAVIAFVSRRSLLAPAALALYLLVAIVTLRMWRRYVTPISRGAGIVVILLPMLFTGPALVTNRACGPYDLLYIVEPFSAYGPDYGAPPTIHNQILLDLFLQLVPWQHQVRQSFINGEWPLWNPTSLSGSVLSATAQPAPYDPLNLIALLLPLDIATTFGVSMTFFLAAFFAFACARSFGVTEGAALIAAIGFAFSSAFTFNVGWPLGRAWTVLPLMILAVRSVVRNRDRRAFVLLTLAFVLVIVFGHPETILHVVAIGAVFGLFEVAPVWRESFRPVMTAVVAGIVALLLTAVFLLPFVSLLDVATERGLRKASMQTREWAAPPEELWRAVRATFMPYSGGATWRTLTKDWEFGTARVGSIILALAIVAFGLIRRRDVRFLLVAGVICMLASWKAAPVGHALHALPLFDITANWRLGFAAAWAFSLLAAIAFDARSELRRARSVVIIVCVALVIATAALWRTQLTVGVDPKLMIAGLTAEVFGVAILLAALSSRSKRVAFALVIAAIAAQRIVEDGNIYPAVSRKLFYRSAPLIDAIPRDPLYRVVGTANILVPNIAGMYGLEDIRGYESMRLARYEETMPLWAPDAKRTYHDVNDLTRPFLSFLGVRHAITPRTMDPPPGWRVVLDDRNSRLMENSRVIPRIFVPRQIRFSDHEESALAEMAQVTDFSETAWIYTRDVAPHTAPNGEATLQVRRIGTRYEVDADSPSGARIVISEASWPGWRAYIDGRRVRMDLANHAFLSLYVPAGKHHVRIVYRPKAFVDGRAISFATIALLCGIPVAMRLKRRAAAAH